MTKREIKAQAKKHCPECKQVFEHFSSLHPGKAKRNWAYLCDQCSYERRLGDYVCPKCIQPHTTLHGLKGDKFHSSGKSSIWFVDEH